MARRTRLRNANDTARKDAQWHEGRKLLDYLTYHARVNEGIFHPDTIKAKEDLWAFIESLIGYRPSTLSPTAALGEPTHAA